jgi:hypothetical protein
MVKVKLEFSDPKSKLLSFHMSGPATYPLCQVKSHGEEQRKEMYYTATTHFGKKQSKHSVNLQGTDMSFSFK